ncbi:acetyl-CoA carboxylase [Lentinula edodes]|nr:acetyl-CoA carboxylase [Lentinula edodes]
MNANVSNALQATFSSEGKGNEEQIWRVACILSSLSGRIPAKLDDSIHAALETAKAQGECPAARIKKVFENFVESSVLPQDRPMFRTQLGAIYDVLDRFTGGLKGHEIKVWTSLLEKYEATERMFGGSIEARILTLREQNKDDLDKVISLVLSHIKVSSKAKLVLTILNHIKTKGISVSNAESPLYKVSQDLASLEAKSSTSVSLKAREVLIMGQMPSYEERLGQMETVLRSSVTSQYYGEQVNTVHTPSAEVSRELSDSRYTVFDVISAFFEHEDHMVPLAASEVYIRRAYKAYTLLTIDYEEGDELDDGDSPSIVTWRFNLGQSHSPPSTPRISLSGESKRSASVSDLTYLTSRHQSQPIRALFDAIEYNSRYGNPQSPPNVLNVALRLLREEDDIPEDAWFEKLTAFTSNPQLFASTAQYPVYLTLREVDRVRTEEQSIRNIEPALAFQLELSHLSSFKLKPVFVESKQIHIYHAVARENQLDNRFFVRALLRPGRLRGSMSSAEYLIFETDRLVTTVLDALELVTAEQRNTDCNHIFLNFIYNLAVTYEDVLAAISGFIERHGKRLWRLHVTGSEIRIALEDDEGNVTPIRCVIENVSGFIVNYHGYQEITTDKGTTILKSIGEKGIAAAQAVPGAPHRYHISFPDLFSKALQNLWDNTRATNPTLTAPGNNTFGMIGWVFTMRTPEFPQGRRVVVVANDITYKIGSFGPMEDQFFYLVTQYARELGLPRIYLSANSGARIGLGEWEREGEIPGKREADGSLLEMMVTGLESENTLASTTSSFHPLVTFAHTLPYYSVYG